MKRKLVCRWSKEDNSFIASYLHFCGFGKTKEIAWKELAIALSGVMEVMEKDIHPERGKENRG